MIKIMFVCLGNICRSPMAEFVFKDMIDKKGLSKEFIIKSAATCNDEIGNDSKKYTIYQKKSSKNHTRGL